MRIQHRNYLRAFASVLDPNRRARNWLARARTRSTYQGYTLLTAGAGNMWIANTIRQRRPAAIGKIGRSELKVLAQWDQGTSTYSASVSEEIYFHSGVFPTTPEALNDFSSYYSDSCRNLDLIAAWGTGDEKRALDEFCSTATLCELEELEPYYHESPWSAELAGLNVLVISPFVDSISRQFELRHQIWDQHPHPVLPDFNLKLLRAYHSEALFPTGFPNWRAMCDEVIDQARTIEFDVAIVGFGAASIPICAALKRRGKIAIHLGGAVQILFGLLGARWDKNPRIAKLVNSYWSRPSDQERPQESHRIERGAYW